MSWSFNAVGRAQSVADKAASDLQKVHCPEPELTIKNKIVEILQVALSPYPTSAAVKVSANGTQYKDEQGAVINTLSVQIESLYGFVE